MVINHKILSIPPHISTSWKNITSIHLEKRESSQILIIILTSGNRIELSDLEETVVQQIFKIHSEVLEKPEEPLVESILNTGMPLKFGMAGMAGIAGMENIGHMMQHHSDQSDSPDLPAEILDKVSSIAKALGMNESGMELPEAEPHCNCPYCQIARALHQESGEENSSENKEEEVSDEELTFRDWDIKQEAENLYDVINPLDPAEHYQVYLGNPVGCTCGNKNCEHIRAVLNT